MLAIAEMQEAARLVEINGDEAFHSVKDRFGEEVALLLAIAHLRRNFGSMQTYPPDPSIDRRVVLHLQARDMLE
jgi:hypothetical protein